VCSVMGWGKIRTSDTYGTHTLHEAKVELLHRCLECLSGKTR
jgi:hypothetical protein